MQQDEETVQINILLIDGYTEGQIQLSAYPSNTFAQIHDAVWESEQKKPKYAKINSFKVYKLQGGRIRKDIPVNQQICKFMEKKVDLSFAILWSPQYQYVGIKVLNKNTIYRHFGSLADLQAVREMMAPDYSSKNVIFTLNGQNLDYSKTIGKIAEEFKRNLLSGSQKGSLILEIKLNTTNISKVNFGIKLEESEIEEKPPIEIMVEENHQKGQKNKPLTLIIQLTDLGQTKTITIETTNNNSFKDIRHLLDKQALKQFPGWVKQEPIKIKQGNNIFKKDDKPFVRIFGDINTITFQIQRQYPGG